MKKVRIRVTADYTDALDVTINTEEVDKVVRKICEVLSQPISEK